MNDGRSLWIGNAGFPRPAIQHSLNVCDERTAGGQGENGRWAGRVGGALPEQTLMRTAFAFGIARVDTPNSRPGLEQCGSQYIDDSLQRSGCLDPRRVRGCRSEGPGSRMGMLNKQRIFKR